MSRLVRKKIRECRRAAAKTSYNNNGFTTLANFLRRPSVFTCLCHGCVLLYCEPFRQADPGLLWRFIGLLLVKPAHSQHLRNLALHDTFATRSERPQSRILLWSVQTSCFLFLVKFLFLKPFGKEGRPIIQLLRLRGLRGITVSSSSTVIYVATK